MTTVSNLDIYPLDLLSASGAHHREGQLRSVVLRFHGLTPNSLCEFYRVEDIESGMLCRVYLSNPFCPQAKGITTDKPLSSDS